LGKAPHHLTPASCLKSCPLVGCRCDLLLLLLLLLLTLPVHSGFPSLQLLPPSTAGHGVLKIKKHNLSPAS
jgi:hypothetical protein